MAENFDLLPTDNDNVERFPEGMLAQQVNDGARKLEGLLARGFRDGTPYATSSGTSAAYAVTPARTITSLSATTVQMFRAHATCSAGATFNLSGLGAYPIKKAFNTPIEANDIKTGQIVALAWDTTNSWWQMLSPVGSTASAQNFGLKVGDVKLSLASSPDAGFLRLGESATAKNKADYPDLNAWASAQGYPWGSTSTTFNLPPAAGYLLRFAATSSSIDTAGARTAGSTQTDQIASHTHPFSGQTGIDTPDHTHAANTAIPTLIGYQGGGSSANVIGGSGSATGGASVNHVHNFSGTTSAAGSGSETRPRNVAMHADILAVPALVASGLTGVGGLYYRWSTDTAASDPGSGYLKSNNATPGSATAIYFSETDANSASLAGVLAAVPANTLFYITKVGTPSVFIAARATAAATDNGTWDTFAITPVASNGTLANGDQVTVTLMLAGATGATGDTGDSGSDGGIRFAFESSTTMAAPAAGGLRFNNATLGSVTAFAIANTSGETGNPTISNWINSWDDSTTTAHRGQITIRKQNAAENFLILDLTSAITDNTTWLTGTVSVVASGGSFTAADTLLVSWSRTGDKGLDGAGSGTMTSVTAGAGLSSAGVGSTGGSLTVSGTLTQVEAVNAQTGTSYTIVAGDHAKLVTLSNASSVAVTLGQATGSFAAGWFCDVANKGAGVVTITPTTSTINGAATFVLSRGQSVRVVSDGTDWQVAQGRGIAGATTTVASASTTDIGAIATDRVSITGTTTITSFGSTPNQVRFGTFAGALTLTHNATSLILPSGASITTAAGDSFTAASDSSGNWRVLHYSKADGTAVVGGAGGSGSPSVPQGRLTLTTATPVLTSSVSGATTVYYAPYVGRCVPIYNGSVFQMHDVGGELSQATTDSTKSPAACTTNSNYDLFVWSDSGTYRCTRGPAWSSDTARGTGAGTTELEMVAGILTNKVAITNGPAANRGTYVGTIRTNGSSQIDFIFGGDAASGSAGKLFVWNAYNRRQLHTIVRDTTNTWTYGTAAWRAAHGSTTMRVEFISGRQEDIVAARYLAPSSSSTGVSGLGGVGFDSTTAASGTYALASVPTTGTSIVAAVSEYATTCLGYHYMQALEYAAASTVTFYGSAGGATYPYIANGLHVEFTM